MIFIELRRNISIYLTFFTNFLIELDSLLMIVLISTLNSRRSVPEPGAVP